MNYLEAVDSYLCLQSITQVANAFKCKHKRDGLFLVVICISENFDIHLHN